MLSTALAIITGLLTLLGYTIITAGVLKFMTARSSYYKTDKAKQVVVLGLLIMTPSLLATLALTL